MTQQHGNYVQGDLFTFVEAPDSIVVEPPKVNTSKAERGRATASTNKSSGSKPAKPVEEEKFEINLETRIKYDGDYRPLTDYFSPQEIEEGILNTESDDPSARRPIVGEDLRLRMKDEYGEMGEKDYVTIKYFKEPNLVLPIIHGRKRGNGAGITDKLNGIYASLEDAQANRRRNMYVPGKDGRVYMIREGQFFTICRRANHVPLVQSLKEGVRYHLPKIPWDILHDFITTARHFAQQHKVELYAEVYWNSEEKEYRLVLPKQLATFNHVTPIEDYRAFDQFWQWDKVMEIHSHHVWEATPSEQDNISEIGTCLYAIVGRLDQLLPEITCRIHIEGDFIPINTNDVFESPFPSKWEKGTNPFPDLVEIGYDDRTTAGNDEVLA